MKKINFTEEEHRAVLDSAMYLRGLPNRVLVAGDNLLDSIDFTTDEWSKLVGHDRDLRAATNALNKNLPPSDES